MIRAITVCVDYDDLLRITLVRNARHLSEILVVTHPDDKRTKEVVASVPSARVFETDAFYRDEKRFNKGLAMEEGLEFFGRDGWILIWDADTLFPETFKLPDLKIGKLYTAPRVILDEPQNWFPGMDWSQMEPRQEGIPAPGYFQLFHAKDQHIRNKRPWYATKFDHAGGGDYHFQKNWSKPDIVYLPFKVLHLGPFDTNWYGRASPRIDGNDNTSEMAANLRAVNQLFGRKNEPVA